MEATNNEENDKSETDNITMTRKFGRNEEVTKITTITRQPRSIGKIV